MVYISKFYIALVVFIAILLGIIVTNNPTVPDDEIIVKNSKIVEPKENIEVEKITPKVSQKSHKIVKQNRVKTYTKQNRYISTHTAKKDRKSIFVQKEQQRFQKELQAKIRYESKQRYIAQRNRATKHREKYFAMQKVMSQRDPTMLKNNSKLMQHTEVRSYLAKVNYQKRQQQLIHQMKMRSKVKK